MTDVTVSSKYHIVIPREARLKLGLSSGTRLQAIPEASGLRVDRVQPPKRSYASWQRVNWADSLKSRSWSRTVNLSHKGTWRLQIRVFDAAGNVSPTRTVTIVRR
jgi:AbrB family looped-hinge helix DNA binding protein